MKSDLRRTWAEIDLDALAHNYMTLRRRAGTGFLGVVKADAYGHGAIRVAHTLEQLGADYLAVANLEEAIELRRAGVAAPVLILGHTPPEQTGQLLQYNITQTVAGVQKAEEYSKAAQAYGGILKVHIKVDTGMSRLGYLVSGDHFENGVSAIAASCRMPNLCGEGIYTHFSVADEDDEANAAYTMEQFALFRRVIDAVAERGVHFALRHCANSGAVTRYPQMALDMVRPGISLYGAGADAEALGLRPVMRLKSTVSTIKWFGAGTDISYGRTYRTKENTRIGVLPIGYADGLFRGLSNKLSVMTAAGPAPVCGRICMDMTMVDLSGKPEIKVGDEVEIFGLCQSVDHLAEMLGTIPYELTCAVSKRVPRIFLREGKPVDWDLRLYL